MTRSYLPFITVLLLLSVSRLSVKSQDYADSILPVRGLAIAVPSPAVLDSFVTFINEELAPKKVNTLVLRVDYNYKYKSHPELVDKDALTPQQVKKIVDACKKIRSASFRRSICSGTSHGLRASGNCCRCIPSLMKLLT